MVGYCEKGLVGVRINDNLLQGAKVGNVDGKSALLLNDGRCFCFWADFDNGQVIPRMDLKDKKDFREAGGTWCSYKEAQIFGHTVNYFEIKEVEEKNEQNL